jgi:hypothetical protein
LLQKEFHKLPVQTPSALPLCLVLTKIGAI